MPFWTFKLMVLGVIIIKIIDLSFGLWSYFLAKQAIKIFSNQQLPEDRPPQIISLEAKKGMRVKKIH